MAAPAVKMLLGAAGSGASSLPAAILALSPLGYWKLNDTSGTTAVDSSGNGRNGTYTGTGYSLANIAGPDGGSYVNLDYANTGNPGYIVIADNNVWSLNNASGLTMFACVSPDSVSGTTRQFILGKGTTSNYEYSWEANAAVAGREGFFINTSAGGTLRSDTTDSGVLSTGWQAVAMYSATPTTSSAIELRRNSNTELGSCTKTVGSGSYSNGTAELYLGYRKDLPSGQFWVGGMAHVAIFAGNVNLSTVFAAADADGWY